MKMTALTLKMELPIALSSSQNMTYQYPGLTVAACEGESQWITNKQKAFAVGFLSDAQYK